MLRMVNLAFLRAAVRGKVLEDATTLEAHSTDASLFKVVPRAVFVPEDAADLAAAVKAVAGVRRKGVPVSLTARAGGTCMSGGSLTESIQVDCTKLDAVDYGGGDTVGVQPGLYYRDLEKLLAGSGWFYPSYPASKNICALGGMLANNAGGEKNLAYGKTNRYVQGLDVVLDDGSRASLRKLDAEELEAKCAQQDREGELYRGMRKLVMDNQRTISEGRPRVTKNSSGYDLWDVYDAKSGTFDLTQVVVGSQGTLCLITGARLRLERPKPYSALTVIFLKDEQRIASLVHDLLAFRPESLESFDNHTLSLAIRFMPVLARHLGGGLVGLALRFIPEAFSVLLHGLPHLTLLVELTGDTQRDVQQRADALHAMLREQKLRFRDAGSGGEASKYWAIRRESFSLLREHVRDRQTAPFIDDLVVRVEDLTEFMPQLEKLMERYADKMTYTIAGHVGDGNFHIIPLMNLHDPDARDAMYRLQQEAVDLTLAFGGSTSGEHNDGLIRTRFVERQFGAEMAGLFEQVKDIWDPQGIFNPGKKVRGDWEFAQKHVK